MASFLAIVRRGSFRAAARERRLSQGAISQQLQKLETQLGVRVIERDPLGCHPTPDGLEFQVYAEGLLKLNAKALGAFRGTPIVVGASSNIGIYLLRPYIKAYLNGREAKELLDVQIHANPVVAEKLVAGDIDVAVMEWWDDRRGYEARLWRREDLVVIVPPGHPWAALSRLPLRLLIGVPLLGGEHGTGTGRILSEYLGENSSELAVGMRLGSTEAVKQWVKAGLGVSLVLAGTVAEEIRAGSLIAIRLVGEGPSKDIYVIWRDSLCIDHPARTFGEWLACCPPKSDIDSNL